MLKKLVNYPGYSITEDGIVFSHKSNKWLKPYKGRLGYMTYNLYGKHRLAHRLVAECYLPKPTKCQIEIDHIDENRSNNNYKNLQWVSHKRNCELSFIRGNRQPHNARKGFKITDKQKRIISEANKRKVFMYKREKHIKTFKSVNDCADWFGVTRITIYNAFQNNGMFRNYVLIREA